MKKKIKNMEFSMKMEHYKILKDHYNQINLIISGNMVKKTINMDYYKPRTLKGLYNHNTTRAKVKKMLAN